MAWDTEPIKTAKSPAAKVLVAVLAIGFFVTVSSWFRPATSVARPPMPTDRLLGEVEGRNYSLQVFAGSGGPLYTVLTQDGRVLRERLTADEVYAAFPDLDVRSLHAGTDLPASVEIMGGH